MGISSHQKSAHKSRNNIAGKGLAGLVNQPVTYEQRQEAELVADVGQENLLLDRYLDAKSGSPEKSAAWAALQKCRAEKRKAH